MLPNANAVVTELQPWWVNMLLHEKLLRLGLEYKGWQKMIYALLNATLPSPKNLLYQKIGPIFLRPFMNSMFYQTLQKFQEREVLVARLFALPIYQFHTCRFYWIIPIKLYLVSNYMGLHVGKVDAFNFFLISIFTHSEYIFTSFCFSLRSRKLHKFYIWWNIFIIEIADDIIGKKKFLFSTTLKNIENSWNKINLQVW